MKTLFLVACLALFSTICSSVAIAQLSSERLARPAQINEPELLGQNEEVLNKVRYFSARMKAMQATLEFDSQGRLSAFVVDGEQVTVLYEGDRQVGISIAGRETRLSYAVSEKHGRADTLIVRSADGSVIDVVRASAVFGHGADVQSNIVRNLPFEQASAENLRAAFTLDQQRSRDAVKEQRKNTRTRCQDSRDCDAARDLDMAGCDHRYEQDMLTVDYIRSSGSFPANVILNAWATALASRASDTKLGCRQRAIGNWLACMSSC